MCPIYEYECEQGHRSEKFRHMGDEHPRAVPCDSCPLEATRVFSPAAVKPDFPEHFNYSMGCIVKNRKHHEQLQRERGLQDWIPKRESPMFSKLRKQGYTL